MQLQLSLQKPNRHLQPIMQPNVFVMSFGQHDWEKTSVGLDERIANADYCDGWKEEEKSTTCKTNARVAKQH